jgi:hypothetical protein
MTSKVEIKSRGIRGGDYSPIKETGNAVTFIDGTNYISVDSFEGQGASYKRRNKAEIEIKLGDVHWKGTANDLYELLKK